MRSLIFLLLYLVSFFPQAVSQIQYLAEGFNNQKVVGSGQILHPTSIRFDANGTGYLTLKRGLVMVIDTLGNLLPTPLLDISEEVVGDADHGMVSIALHPNFLSNGYFYVLYSVDRHYLMTYGTPAYDPTFTIEKQATIGRITRFQADASKGFKEVVEGSRKILVGKNAQDLSFPILMSSHGMGSLVFAEDGTLLASGGDAASFQAPDFGSSEHSYFQQALEDGILREKDNVGAFRSQMVDNLAGKIIRIDPHTGEGIASNPFFDATTPNAPKSKVWAMGFRNPFRFIIEPGSGSHNPLEGQPGTLFVGDVGSGWWEELNVVKSGGENFGWPLYEGYWWGWEFWPTKVTNFDAPNELARVANCPNTFYHFQDLFQEENEQGNYFFPNPCVPDQSLAIDTNIPVFHHTRPIITWSNHLWNKPARSLVPSFDSIGKAIALPLEESPVITEKTDFAGFSSMPAIYYKEGSFPKKYKEALFVSDFSGWIKTFYLDEQKQLVRVEEFMDRDTGIVDVTMHPKDGCMYYVHYNSHSVQKICYGGSVPPVANFQVDQQFGSSPLTVQFNAGASYDPNNLVLDYLWDFGDGMTSTESNPSHIFVSSNTAPTTFLVKLLITNSEGLSDSQTTVVSLNNTPPTVQISSPSAGSFYGSNDLNYLQLQAEVTDAEHDAGQLDYTWQVFFHHNTHYHEEPPKKEKQPHVIIEPTDCATTEVFWYRFRLEVTDENGLSTTDELEIYPYCEGSFFEITNLTTLGSRETIMLTWDVESEEEVALYEIQRTEDFRFETIGMVTSKGVGAYSFEDKLPIEGRNIYRIKAVRSDNAYDYSNQSSTNFPAEPEIISIYPNPTKVGLITIFTKYPIAENLSFTLFDPIGRTLYETAWKAEFGEPIEHKLNISYLPSGVYFYSVQNGEQLVNGKLIIVKGN